nr:hypothetical protein [Streptomyces sp. M54]
MMTAIPARQTRAPITSKRWKCHARPSQFPEEDYLFSIREKANDHAAACRAIPLT